VFLLVLPLLAAPLPAQDDDIPPGPLKDLMDGLKRGDKEIRIDLLQSELDSIEHGLGKDKAKTIPRLEAYLADLGPKARAKGASLGATTAYTDAITLARRHKIRKIKDAYLMQPPEKGYALLDFELPRSGRWSYKPDKGARGAIFQQDRKGKTVRTISFQMFHKKFEYEYEGKVFDGSNVLMVAKASAVFVAKQYEKIRKRYPVRAAKLNKHVRKASTFKIEAFDAKGGFCRTRAYFFRFKGDPDVTLCVKVRDLVDSRDADPESEAVIATIRDKPKAKAPK
jgi:hypothetical protein